MSYRANPTLPFIKGGQHSKEVAFALLTQSAWVWFSALPRFFKFEFLDVVEIYRQQCPALCVDSAWKCLIVDWTHLVQASGKLELQKIPFVSVWNFTQTSICSSRLKRAMLDFGQNLDFSFSLMPHYVSGQSFAHWHSFGVSVSSQDLRDPIIN